MKFKTDPKQLTDDALIECCIILDAALVNTSYGPEVAWDRLYGVRQLYTREAWSRGIPFEEVREDRLLRHKK